MNIAIIGLIFYLLIALGFFVIICIEARQKQFEVGIMGIVVAIGWLPWMTAYIVSTIKNKYRKR